MVLTLQSLMVRLPGKCDIIGVLIVVIGQITSRLSNVDSSIISTNLGLHLDVIQDTVDQITERDSFTYPFRRIHITRTGCLLRLRDCLYSIPPNGIFSWSGRFFMGLTQSDLGAVYIRAGTERLPGRDE